MQTYTIALDIDGTITDKEYLIPDRVVAYFKDLYRQGHTFIFATGRTFVFAFPTLSKIDFPYFLAVQNGADLLSMPDKKLLFQNYLDRNVVLELEKIYQDEKEDFLLYAGYEKGDLCFYRPKKFSEEMLHYFRSSEGLKKTNWHSVTSFKGILNQKKFSLIKCIGSRERCEEIKKKLTKDFSLQMSLVKDPFNLNLYLLLITASEANKGNAIQKLIHTFKLPSFLIAAGDDMNDISLLKIADKKIAMENAPKELQKHAHLIAPSSQKLGIIAALNQVMNEIGP